MRDWVERTVAFYEEHGTAYWPWGTAGPRAGSRGAKTRAGAMEQSMYDHTFLAEEGHWWTLGKRSLWKRALVAHLGSTPGRILDAGCGTGGHLARFAMFGIGVGTDVSPYASGLSRLREVRRLVASTAEALPFRAGSFDAVMSFDAISHKRVGDDKSTLAEFARVLRPGGPLLNLPAFASLGGHHDQVGHIDKRYTRGELRSKIERAGFMVERNTYWNSFLFAPAAAWRRAARLRGKAVAEAKGDFFVGGAALNTVGQWHMRLEMALVAHLDLPSASPSSPSRGSRRMAAH